jgi:hypothetical protein
MARERRAQSAGVEVGASRAVQSVGEPAGVEVAR